MKMRIGELCYNALKLTAVCWILAHPSSARAEVSVREISGDWPARLIEITGKIDAATAEEFVEVLSSPGANIHSEILVSGPGGSVDAAIRIGREIRDRQMSTWVPEERDCASSCALIFVAGVKRRMDGSLSLHRPYLVLSPTSPRATADDIRDMYSSIGAYLSEMNVSTELYDIMIATPPETVRTLTRLDQALIDRLIPSVDPVYDELRIGEAALRFGVDTATLRYRKQWAAENCQQIYVVFEDVVACFLAADWGLSVDDYRAAASQAKATCTESLGSPAHRYCVDQDMRRQTNQ